MCVCACACEHVHVCAHMWVCACVHVYLCACVCVCVCGYVCMLSPVESVCERGGSGHGGDGGRASVATQYGDDADNL